MDAIDRIRRFNRFYTARAGLLGRQYAGLGLSLGELRVIYELAERGSWTPRKCAETLGLDEGYVSRILKRLQGVGWVSRETSRTDRRVRTISITEAGRAKLDEMKAVARADMRSRLEDCSESAITAAADALDRATALLMPPDPATVTLRDFAIGDIGWLTQQHGEYYARTEGFDETFEPLVADILTAFARNRDPATERAFFAEAGGQRLGSIFCVQSGTPGIAKLRLFYLVPEARGLGLGKRLIGECLTFARSAGYSQMRLWTHESHRAACALYARTGFMLTRSEPVTSFGVDLVEQTWEITL